VDSNGWLTRRRRGACSDFEVDRPWTVHESADVW